MTEASSKNITRKLLRWYSGAARDLPWRRTTDPYAIWVSEVMLQQTRVRTAIPYYEAWMARFPDIGTLAAAGEDAVLKTWEGMGYYARARNLRRAAAIVARDHAGRVPDDPDVFGRLPGVGAYIRAAVTSIAFGAPVAAVDGNVKRVLARLFAVEAPVDRASSTPVFTHYAQRLLDPDDPGRCNQAMMELGATICRPAKTACTRCPLATNCRARADGLVETLPVRAGKRPVPVVHAAVGVVSDGRRVLITRRPSEGLLGGLWEFPGGKVRPGEPAEAACAREIHEEAGIEVEVETHLTRVRHAYTHFRLELDVFRCRLAGGEVVLNGPVDHRWVLLEEIESYAFPAANRKFFPLLRDTGHDGEQPLVPAAESQ